MTTYTFLKALDLLISKMQQYRAENNFPQRNSTKTTFFGSQIYTFLDIYGCYHYSDSNNVLLRPDG